LLIFAFFMISDPKTTPNARLGRVVYAGFVALIGFIIQFGFHNSAGIILALIITAPFVPLIDKVFKGGLYHWPRPGAFSPSLKGVSHEHIKIPAE